MDSPVKDFFASLYDVSFRTFVTPKIVRVVYVIALTIIFLWSMSFLIAGFATTTTDFGSRAPEASTMLFHVVGAVGAFVVGSIAARINLEFVIAVFRIAENTDSLRGAPTAPVRTP